jgi:uncharacterized membrane protein YfcA
MMVCSVLVRGISLFSLRRRIDWRGGLPLILGGLAGLPPALYVLVHADPVLFRIGFGVFLTAYAAYMLLRPAVHPLRNVAAGRYEVAVGLLGGLVGGLTAMPGAVPTIWCDLRGLRRIASGASSAHHRDADRGLAIAVDRGIPRRWAPGPRSSRRSPSLVGLALFGRVSDGQFRRVLLSVLLLSGIAYVF